MGWHVPRGRLTLAKLVRRVRFPLGPPFIIGRKKMKRGILVLILVCVGGWLLVDWTGPNLIGFTVDTIEHWGTDTPASVKSGFFALVNLGLSIFIIGVILQSVFRGLIAPLFFGSVEKKFHQLDQKLDRIDRKW